MSACIVVLLQTPGESEVLLNYAKLNCAVRYLKSVNWLETSYPEHVTHESEECQSFIDEFLESAYNDVYSFFAEQTNGLGSDGVDCVVSELRAKHMAESSLKRALLSHSESMSRREKTLKINGVTFKINSLLTDAVNFCLDTLIT